MANPFSQVAKLTGILTLGSATVLGLTAFGHYSRVNFYERNLVEDSHKRAHIIGDKQMLYQLVKPQIELPSTTTSASTSEQQQNKYLIVYLNETGTTKPVVPLPNDVYPQRAESNVEFLHFYRLGTGFSDNTTTPRHAANNAIELQSLISSIQKQQNTNYQVILVAEGFSALISRVFASNLSKHTPVAGLVLLNPIVEKSLEDDQFRSNVSREMKQAKFLSMMSSLGFIEWLNLLSSTSLSNKSQDWNTFVNERTNLVKSCKQAHESRAGLKCPVVILDNSTPLISNKEREERNALYMQGIVSATAHPLSEFKRVDTSSPAVLQNEVSRAVERFIRV